MLTIGPLPAWAAREVRQLAAKNGCKLSETASGFALWRTWTFTIEGGDIAQMQRCLADLEREFRWWQAIR